MLSATEHSSRSGDSNAIDANLETNVSAEFPGLSQRFVSIRLMQLGSLTRLVDAVRVATHSARRGANSMRLHSRLTWFVAIAVLGYAASPAGAQTPGGGGGTPPGPGFDTQVGFNQQINIPMEQQVSVVNAHLTYTGQVRETVQKQLQSARQQRDVVKVLCLNDKLNQVDVAHRTLGERQKAHLAAVQRRDRELANHEFTIITVVRKNVEQKMTEANQCIGQEAAYTGTTTTFTTVDPNLPPGDQTEPPGAGMGDNPFPPVEIGPPTPASPHK